MTYTRKTLFVDIDDDRTVIDLKRKLYMLPDVASPPELQRLIYDGKILRNDFQLNTYAIDERKPLVIMILQHMEKVMDEKKAAADGEPGPSSSVTPAFKKKPLSNTTKYSEKSKHEKMVENIVNMGYPEENVRRALSASFYNPERAIEYLVDGIPTSPSTPEGNTSAGLNTSDSSEVSPFEFLRTDPGFRRLRRKIMRNPELLDTAASRMGELNPQVLRYVNENHKEFLNALFEPSDDDEDENNEGTEDSSNEEADKTKE